MKKLIFLLLALGSLQSFGQVSKIEVNDLIDSKLTNSVRPSDIKAVTKKLSDFANQGDSAAKTKEPFIVPGSSGSYLNGLKQWIPFPDLSIYATNAYVIGGYSPLGHTHAWSVITGKPTTVATSGITDAVSLAGAQALSNKTGNISQWTNNTGYLTGITSGQVTGALGFTPYNATNPSGYISGITSAQVTGALGFTPYNSTNPSGYLTGINSGQVTTALGYIPVNPASTPSLLPTANDVQNVGGTINYYANGYLRQLNLNSTASINGATNGKVSITGVLKGNGAELTDIPYEAISNPPSIPADNTLVHLAGTETITGAKNFTTNPTYNGSQLVNVSGSQTITSKVLSGSNNTFSNIPSTAISNTTFATTAGANTFLNTATFTDTWVNYQAKFGAVNQAGIIGFSNGTNGLTTGRIGYVGATAGSSLIMDAGGASGTLQLQTNSSTKITIFPTGNTVIQNGGTFTDAGYLADIRGTSYLGGTATIQGHVVPVADGTQSMGIAGASWGASRFTSILTDVVKSRSGSNLSIRNSADMNIIRVYESGNVGMQNGGTFTDNTAGVQVSHDITATAGKAWGQTFTPILRASANNDELIGTVIAPALLTGSFTGVTPYALRVGSAMKMDGQIDLGGHIIGQADNIYNLGSSARRFGNVYSINYFGNTFLGTAGTTTFGTNNTANNIDIRQGSTTQLVAGWHPSGNMFIQPRGVRPPDSGDGLQITGTTVIKGELRNEIGLGGFRTSDFFGATTMSFHNLNGTPSASNFFLVNSPGPTGQTYLSGNEGVSLLLGTLPRVSVTEGQTEITENLKINATPEHADNAAALAAGLAIGRVYRTGDILKIVH